MGLLRRWARVVRRGGVHDRGETGPGEEHRHWVEQGPDTAPPHISRATGLSEPVLQLRKEDAAPAAQALAVKTTGAVMGSCVRPRRHGRPCCQAREQAS